MGSHPANFQLSVGYPRVCPGTPSLSHVYKTLTKGALNRAKFDLFLFEFLNVLFCT